MFRCVYCLHREQWYGRTRTFEIDHFTPLAVNPEGECEYSNLVYACATCNSFKRDAESLPDPCHVAFSDCLCVNRDGTVLALNSIGEELCDRLRLNDHENIDHRSRWIRLFEALRATHPVLFQELMSFPRDLPDLRNPKMRPPRNTKPDGAENCYFALRERGELPETY
ncbi:MAG: HNH endonuclease [Planctomycetaceae bacterium]